MPDPYSNTITTEGYATGNAVKPSPFTMKYRATIYQGDTTFATRFMDSLAFATGTDLPTGSVAYLDNATGTVKPGVGTASASNCPVPYIVYMGTDQKTVQSQRGNIAGGIVSLLPSTGYYRVVTTVFDTSKTYAAGDYLKVTTGAFGDYTGIGLLTNGATVYTDVVVGIADGPAGVDHFELPSLKFTCYFIPPVKA